MMSYQDALERALELAEDRAALDAFLKSVPSWRADLEQAVEISRSLSGELRAIAPGEGSRDQAQRQLMSTVSRLAAAPEARTSLLTKLLGLLTPSRILIAGAAAGVLLAVAVVVDLPIQSGGGTQTAEAVVLEGSVSEVGAGVVTIFISDSSDSARVVKLSSDTVLTDSFGNTVQASSLSAGQDVVLKGSDSGEEIVASQVELRDRLFGVVTALPGDSIHLSSPKGEFVILVTPETEFEGRVAIGSFVEVKLIREPDGSLRALEIEVEDEGEDEHEADEDRGGASPSPGPSAPNNPPSGDPGSSGGGGGTVEEDDDGGSDDSQEEEDEDSSDEHEDEEEDH